MKNIDCKKLACPEPVIRTKNELAGMKGGESLSVMVDNASAAENVSRYAENQHCKVTKTQSDTDFIITITKGTIPVNETKTIRLSGSLLFVKSAVIGSGNDELGRVLINAFFNTVADYEFPPKKIFFINSGIMLTVSGSDVLQALKKLEGKGVEIYSCGTCLDFYKLKDKLAVGKVGNMYQLEENLFSYNVIYI